MSDPIDQLNCGDVVCARSGHYACHDLPPPKPQLLDCGHDEYYESVLGHCRACDFEHATVSEGR